MDYRALLGKYIRHVAACEGTAFITEINDPWLGDIVKFTDEEQAALTSLASEVL